MKSIINLWQYYVANGVSWVPRLTSLDLQMRSWIRTCSFTGDLLYCSLILGLGKSPGGGIGCPLQYFWVFLVAQVVKNLPALWETWIQSLGWEDPLEKGTWMFTGRTDAEAPVFWSSDESRWLIEKVPDAGKDWGQKEKRASEDEMAGIHHWCNEHELGQTPGDGEGQGRLECCSPWGRKELDMTGQINNSNCIILVLIGASLHKNLGFKMLYLE